VGPVLLDCVLHQLKVRRAQAQQADNQSLSAALLPKDIKKLEHAQRNNKMSE